MKCPCCNSNEINNFLETYVLKSCAWYSKKLRVTDFKHTPNYCFNCGHIFNSSAPTEAEMKNFYLDQFLHTHEAYNIENRIKIIESLFKNNGKIRFLDFGGNSKLSFHKLLEKKGYILKIIDVENSFKKEKFDIISAYSVLPHLINLNKIMKIFDKILAENGKIIIEVPNSNFYKDDYSGLIYESQHHFQPSSLSHLFSRYGFRELYYSKDNSSRDFQFVSVYEKSKTKQKLRVPNKDAIECYKLGRQKQILEKNFPELFFKSFNKSNLIVLWGVNRYLFKILESNVLNDYKIITLDINSKKNFLLDEYNFDFYTPSEFFQNYKMILAKYNVNISQTEFVITAVAYYASIKKEINLISKKVHIYDPLKKVKDKL